MICVWLCGKAIKTVFLPNQREAVRDANANVMIILLLKTHIKEFSCYHLLYILTIVLTVAALCVSVKSNSTEICEEIYFRFRRQI